MTTFLRIKTLTENVDNDTYINDIDNMVDIMINNGIKDKNKFVKYCKKEQNKFIKDIDDGIDDLAIEYMLYFRINYLDKAMMYINKINKKIN